MSNIKNPRFVSRDKWLEARKELLAQEKQLTRQHDALSLPIGAVTRRFDLIG
jgi:predicted dithiol-disulfide oxidoreductase (DUF899 family)